MSDDRTAALQRTITEIATFVLLVSGGAAVRLVFHDLPNFAPVAAVALFAGYFFRSWQVALCVPLCIMAISDFFIGGYSWYMMMVIYGALSLPVAMRGLLRSNLRMRRGKISSAMLTVAALLACGLFSSLLFFAISNLAVWFWFADYAFTPLGLAECFAAALPFFRYTLTGDGLFALLLFGSYALALNLGIVDEINTVSELDTDRLAMISPKS